jgi:branched-chain amino acid aminotransferase
VSAWIDGAFDGRIDPADRGLTLGDGVFDTLAAFRRVPFAGERHLERLTAQAASIGIRLDPHLVRRGWSEVLDAAATEHVVLRTTVTRGPAGRGLWPDAPPRPTLMVTAAPWNPALFGRPARLVVSAIARNPTSPASRLKSLNYLDNILAAREAAEAGATDALFLNPAGAVACTTIANVFALTGDRLLTPPLSDGVQPGIVRALVLEAAPALGLVPEQASLSLAELRQADAVFLTNSIRFLAPALSLGSELLGRGSERTKGLAAHLAALVESECGFDPRSAV